MKQLIRRAIYSYETFTMECTICDFASLSGKPVLRRPFRWFMQKKRYCERCGNIMTVEKQIKRG